MNERDRRGGERSRQKVATTASTSTLPRSRGQRSYLVAAVFALFRGRVASSSVMRLSCSVTISTRAETSATGRIGAS